jgi:hypothetical protein
MSDEPTAEPKRRKSTSPTARTLNECRRRGWTAGVVERHIPFPRPQGTKIDLFGVIDLVVIVPPDPEPEYEDDRQRDQRLSGRQGAILAIQACSGGRTGKDGRGSDHAARRAKILAEPRAKAWVDAGGRLEIWSWSQRAGAGKRKLWTLRVETYEEMLSTRGSGSE